MTSSENQPWTKKHRNEDAVYTLNVDETVVGIRQSNNNNSSSDYVRPVTRKTTRSHKVSIASTREIV